MPKFNYYLEENIRLNYMHLHWLMRCALEWELLGFHRNAKHFEQEAKVVWFEIQLMEQEWIVGTPAPTT